MVEVLFLLESTSTGVIANDPRTERSKHTFEDESHLCYSDWFPVSFMIDLVYFKALRGLTSCPPEEFILDLFILLF